MINSHMPCFPHVLLTLDDADVITSASGEVERLLGYRPEELVDVEVAIVMERHGSREGWGVCAVTCRTKAGFEWRTWCRSAPIFAPDGAPLGSLELFSDALRAKDEHTARWGQPALSRDSTPEAFLADRDPVAAVVDASARAHDTTRRQHEARFRELAESLPQLVWAASPAGRCDYVNERWSHYTGRTGEALRDDGWLDSLHAEDRPRVTREWEASVRSGEPFCTEGRLRRHDGTHRWFDLRAVAVRSPSGAITRWFGAHTDVDEARTTREHLRAAQTQLTTALEAGQMGVWIVRTLDDELWADDQLLQVFGRTRAELEAQPEGLLAFVHPDDRPALDEENRRLRDGGLFASLEFRVTRGDGQLAWLACRCRTEFDEARRVVAVVGVTWDITRQKAEQEGQLRSQKMESLGTLASGIAHDFNNLLQAIEGHAILASESVPPSLEAAANIEQILRASARGADLVRRILAFSRPEECERERVDMAFVAREAVELLRATLPTSIALRIQFGGAPLPVMASATQLHQVIVNLATNAAHALGERPGTIEIALQEVEIGDDDFDGKRGVRAGPHIMLSVRDDGCGMSAATRARIFDPFFTTKGSGKGTGLGLSVVHGIVTSSGGSIEVRSAEGEGSEFRVYLPRTSAPAAVRTSSPALQPRGNGEHVLYVEDDPILMALGQTLIEHLGYRVTPCPGPHRALEVFAERPDEFDIVLSDVTMPVLSGFDLTRRVLELRGDIPVLVMSGYVGPEERARSQEVGAREILVKPVNMTEFGRAIARNLGAR